MSGKAARQGHSVPVTPPARPLPSAFKRPDGGAGADKPSKRTLPESMRGCPRALGKTLSTIGVRERTPKPRETPLPAPRDGCPWTPPHGATGDTGQGSSSSVTGVHTELRDGPAMPPWGPARGPGSRGPRERLCTGVPAPPPPGRRAGATRCPRSDGHARTTVCSPSGSCGADVYRYGPCPRRARPRTGSSLQVAGDGGDR